MGKQFTLNQLKGAIFGLAVGDALGVPAEFKHRDTLRKNPIKTMIGYGTHNQPPGTWSDDSSLTFCLLESLCDGYNLQDIGDSFVKWFYLNHWTPHGKVFDIGGTTREAIRNLKNGVDPKTAGPDSVHSNGNGSLMRIIPMAFEVIDLPIEERYNKVAEVSSVTHRHLRSIMGCFIYIEYAILLIKGLDKWEAYQQMQKTILAFIADKADLKSEAKHYKYILQDKITKLSEQEVQSSGYVLHTLEASLWTFLRNDAYDRTVLEAINLGEDTDTTGAVVGGLAGLYYGYEKIPLDWVIHLAREQDIDVLCERYYRKLESNE